MRCIDKQGQLFEVGKYNPEHFSLLETMYLDFYPKGKFQGMPPLKDELNRKWVKRLLKQGENFLAWKGGKPVGHVAILPDFEKRDAEYLIFVSQPNRDRGIGSELTRMVILHARGLGLTSVWLTVGATNFRAIGLYRKFGFDFLNVDIADAERQMILHL